VTKGFGRVVSIAGKFGMRREEVCALLALAKAWAGRSVEDVSNRYERLAPGYDLKERLMRSVVCMFDSGYTLPQGREVINYYYPLQFGLGGILETARLKAAEAAGRAGGDGRQGMNRLYNYQAVACAVEGVQNWILNYSKEASALSREAADPARSKEYAALAERLAWVARNPPRDFRDAVQLCWTLHVAVLNEDAISGLSPGRLGQVLYPYYQRDLEEGRITREEALELLECQRVKFTCIDCFASTGVVGGVLSGNTFNNLSVGGLDAEGRSASNGLEELILEAGMRCATPQPTLSVLYDDALPEPFLLKAVECVKTGCGYPAFMNNRVALRFLLGQYAREGMGEAEARAWAVGGCLETSPCSWMPLKLGDRTWSIPGGSGQPTSVGVHFVSLPKLLELALFDGVDERTGERVFAPHGRELTGARAVFSAVQDYFSSAVDALCRCNNIQHDLWRKANMAVFHSMLKPDCLEKGHLIDEMGYRYNGTYNVETTGTVNLVNGLAALEKVVFEDRAATLGELKAALLENFGYRPARETGSYSLDEQRKRPGGEAFDEIHARCLRAPKYGNDDPKADAWLKEWEDFLAAECRRHESLFAAPLYPCQISVSTHGAMGSAALAGPDGRLGGTTFADGSLSAYPGTDRRGPYALFSSATVWDHSTSQNSQLNLKLHPASVRGSSGTRKLLELTRAYLRKGGFHVQYNVVDSATLREAQKNPAAHRELMVRVAGFTQYWVEIGKSIQDEIIARTEYGEV
jgi:4-hydroxyphenylacetate decarboxylase large subunit